MRVSIRPCLEEGKREAIVSKEAYMVDKLLDVSGCRFGRMVVFGL
jgi:hypothetical protein